MVGSKSPAVASGKNANSLDQLQPAKAQLVGIFMPYFAENKRKYLPLAINLYKEGNLEGQREIIGGENIPFIATWSVSSSFLPSDLSRCRMQFDGNPELTYEVTITVSDLIEDLWSVIVKYKQNRVVDFPKAFYFKLLQRER